MEKFDNKSNVEYVRETHIDILAKAIDRMGNNHFRFMIFLYSIAGFSLTLNRFIWEMDSTSDSLLFFGVNGALSLLAMVFCSTMSHKYLNLERAFRNLQSDVFQGKISDYTMNPIPFMQNKQKGGFTHWFEVGVTLLTLFATIAFMAVKGCS